MVESKVLTNDALSYRPVGEAEELRLVGREEYDKQFITSVQGIFIERFNFLPITCALSIYLEHSPATCYKYENSENCAGVYGIPLGPVNKGRNSLFQGHLGLEGYINYA